MRHHSGAFATCAVLNQGCGLQEPQRPKGHSYDGALTPATIIILVMVFGKANLFK